MTFTNGGFFVRKELFSNIIKFVICMIIFFYGAALLLFGLFGSHIEERKTEIIAISTFSLISAIYISSQIQISNLLGFNPVIIHYTNYLSMIIFPYPAVVYVSEITGNKKSHFLIVSGAFTFLNVLCQTAITHLGISDYHQMLPLTQAEIIVSLISVLILITRGINQKNIDKKMYKMLMASFGAAGLTGGFDVVNYFLHKNRESYGNVFQFGLLFFIAIFGVYEITVIIELKKKGQNAEIMERLAYHDVLTGIWNRQAYMREEAILRTKTEGAYTFIMFDVNNLKPMNDKFGHDFGDELIKTAAVIIEKSFGHRGKCFRMGGDEFFVIYDFSTNSDEFANDCKNFENNISAYNVDNKLPLPLSIAYGYEEYKCGSDKIEAIERKADNKMYEMKVGMKAARK